MYNNCTNRSTERPSALRYFKKLIPPGKIFPFGARVKIIKDLPSQRGDSIFPSVTERVFLGYSSTDDVALVYKQSDAGNRVRRVHYLVIDSHGLSMSASDTLLPNEYLLQNVHISVFTGKDQAIATVNLLELEHDLQQLELDYVDSLFDPNECAAFEVTLPPRGRPIDMTFLLMKTICFPFLSELILMRQFILRFLFNIIFARVGLFRFRMNDH